MSIDGFHVTKTRYHAGQVAQVGTGQSTHFYAGLEMADNLAGEERLERHRPDGAPCRRSCIYVFQSLETCSFYGSTQHPDAEVYYYRVRMTGAVKAPMVLVDAIRRQVDPSASQVERMAREYWSPTRDWQVWEYLTETVEVMEEVQPLAANSSAVMMAQCSYQSDHELAKSFCREAMLSK
jgi:hypothetical protein